MQLSCRWCDVRWLNANPTYQQPRRPKQMGGMMHSIVPCQDACRPEMPVNITEPQFHIQQCNYNLLAVAGVLPRGICLRHWCPQGKELADLPVQKRLRDAFLQSLHDQKETDCSMTKGSNKFTPSLGVGARQFVRGLSSGELRGRPVAKSQLL